MVVTLAGNNVFAMRQKLNEIVSAFVAEHGELGVEKIDGQEVTEKLVLEAIQSMPLLANRKLVVLKNGSSNKAIVEHIEQIIGSITESTDLVLYESSIDRRTSYFKLLKNKTQLQELNELDTQTLAKWLVEQTRNQNGEISFSDASYLIERVGTEQQNLAQELEKLIIYEPKITRQSIELLTEPTPQSKVFDLLDCAFSGNKQRALKLYEEQRAQKVEPQFIIGMIAWQLRLIALAKYGGSRSSGQIAADAGVKPYPVDKARRLAKGLSENQLKQMISDALDIDYKSKTTSLNLDEALKTYIVSI